MDQVIHIDDDNENHKRKAWEAWLDDLLEKDSGMTGKELDFIDDLDQKWRGKSLTGRQEDWLKAIWERVC